MDAQFKVTITDTVSSLVESLSSFERLAFEVSQDRNLQESQGQKLKKSFDKIKNIIANGIRKMLSDIEKLNKTIEWDKLNVSFFGETNAGKSTIIEALINGDGKSIGEGVKDFTKTITKVPYKNINLLDMPGIEGRENKVITEIHDAIKRSHIVFYIIGTNKEPEETTLRKIRNFLRDNAKVYSIINVRRRPSAYNYVKDLRTEDINTIEKRVENKFSEVLGANYFGNIVINGYLALLKNNSIKGTRFQSDQDKALRNFVSLEKIAEFSNIQELINLINEFGKRFGHEIDVSNTYKFLKSLDDVLANILGEKKNFDAVLREIDMLIGKYNNDIDAILKRYSYQIENLIDTNINSFKAQLKKTVAEAIDRGDSEESINAEIKKINKNQMDKLNKNLEEILSSIRKEIERSIEEFKNRLSLKIEYIDIRGDFDLEKALDALKINLTYVLKQIVDLALGAFAIILSLAIPVLAIFTGLLLFIKKIWEWLFGDPLKRKQEAKKKAYEEIDSEVEKIKKEAEKVIKKQLEKVKLDIKLPVDQLHKNMKKLKEMSSIIDNKISEIIKCIGTLSTLLTQQILGKEVLFSFIDLRLSQAVIIGSAANSYAKDYLIDIFRLRDIKLYPSYDDWLSKSGNLNEDVVFSANDEFNLRAMKTAMLCCREGLKIRKVKRDTKEEVNLWLSN